MKFQWLEDPHHTRNRKSSPFRSTYSSTVKLLERELNAIRARNVILAAGYQSHQIKNDGMPYARATLRHPAAALYFTVGAKSLGAESLAFPCDTFDSFPDNLRAIALTLEKLRAVDCYGVTRKGEQYRGWAALPAPTKPERVLAEASGMTIQTPQDVQSAYRAAARRHHPDVGGDNERWLEIQRAYTDLRGAAHS